MERQCTGGVWMVIGLTGVQRGGGVWQWSKPHLSSYITGSNLNYSSACCGFILSNHPQKWRKVKWGGRWRQKLPWNDQQGLVLVTNMSSIHHGSLGLWHAKAQWGVKPNEASVEITVVLVSHFKQFVGTTLSCLKCKLYKMCISPRCVIGFVLGEKKTTPKHSLGFTYKVSCK